MSTTNSGSDGTGRRSPPSSSRYQPGQSGNPSGRPKGSKNLKTIAEGVLGKLVTVTENGKQVRRTVAEVMLLRHAQNGMKGDHRSADLLLRSARALGVGQNEEAGKASPRSGADDGQMPDKAALRRILKRLENIDLSEDREPDGR
jgi:hypothetical protein